LERFDYLYLRNILTYLQNAVSVCNTKTPNHIYKHVIVFKCMVDRWLYNCIARRSSSAVLMTSSAMSSSHVTSPLTTRHDVTSVDYAVMTSNDFTVSLVIGALLFIPVTVILCVTVVIRLRKSGKSTSPRP